MLKRATVFLGGGRITSALAAGLRLAGDKRAIVAYDRNPAKLKKMRRESQVQTATDLKWAVERAEILIVAVRPQSVSQLLQDVAGCGAHPGLCVSLAAGVPLRSLRKGLGGTARWVRAMPSPVCRAALGLTALAFDSAVSKKDRARVRQFFARVGQVVEIPEQALDVFTATYSSSHGYHALAALAEAARRAGMDRETAMMAAAHALADGIQYWRGSGLPLQTLLEEAATPGGTAAAAMEAMDKAGYGRAVERGIQAGIRRARKNAKT